MKKGREEENSELRIRFFEVTVKGSSSTVEEAIRNVANVAINRTVSGQPSNAALPAPTANGNKEKVEEQTAMNFDDVQEGNIVDAAATPAATAKSSSPKQERNRTYATPDILHNLDLKKGAIAFEDFCKSKNPDSDNKRYLVIAAWFKEYGNVSEITTSHIYTCWRAMGWSNYPTDFGRPFRRCKESGWFKAVSAGLYEINHLGLDVVNKLGAK